MDNKPIQDENPYLVSDSVNERWEPIRDSDAKPPNQTMLYIGWFAVWLLNMFFPIGILVSSPASEESSMSSIAIGCGALSVLCLGFALAHRLPSLLELITRGGVVVGLSQIIPIIHILCGLLSLSVVRLIAPVYGGTWQPDDFGNLGFVGGFLVTALFGIFLLLPCIMAGVVLRAITPSHWWLDPNARLK